MKIYHKPIQISLLAFFSLLMACEAPRDRALSRGETRGAQASTKPEVYYISPNPTAGDEKSADEDDDDKTDKNTTSETFPGIPSYCNFSTSDSSPFQHTSNLFGPFNLCRDQSVANRIYVHFKNPITESLCFFPTNISGENVVLLGDPVCLSSSDKAHTVELRKSAIENFDSSPYNINSIVMMYDSFAYYQAPFNQTMRHPDAFIRCFITQLNRTGLKCNSSGVCVNNYCEAFKKVNQYLKLTL